MKQWIGVALTGCTLLGGVLFNGGEAAAKDKNPKTKPQKTTGAKPITVQPAVSPAPTMQGGLQEVLLLKVEADLPRQEGIVASLAELPFIRTQLAPGEAWSARLRRVPAQELNARTSLINSGEFGPRQKDGSTGEDGIALERADGTILIMLDNDARTMMLPLLHAVQTEQRWQFLKSLPPQMPESKLGISLRLVPVDVEKDAQGIVTRVVGDKVWPRDAAGQITATEGDYLMAEVANTGTDAEYVTVFDLPSDGQIQPILPVPRMPIDNLIPPDTQWHRLPMPYVFVLDRSRGTGIDIFKAVATRDPVDFTPWLNYRWPNHQRGALADFAKEWATDQVTMQIIKRDVPAVKADH